MLEAAVTDAVDDDWVDRVAIGWFLALPLVLAVPAWVSFSSPLALPLALAGVFALVGYGRRVLAASVVEPNLPAPDDWTALGRSTVVGALVVSALVGLPTGLVALALFRDASPVAGVVSDLIAAAVVVLVFVAGAYLTPAVLAISGRSAGVERPALEGRSRRSALGAIVASRDYVVATLQAILIAFTVGAATLILLVTVFGLVFLPAVVFLALAVVARRYAYAVDRALSPSVVAELEERTVPWL